jgi:predicted outer membrane protein
VGFSSEQAKLAGKKSSKLGKKNFATVVLDRFKRKTKSFSELYLLALERQLKILSTAKTEDRNLSQEEIKEFEALAKVTNKAFDKLLPNLQHSDVNVNEIKRIEVVDLTDETVNKVSFSDN